VAEREKETMKERSATGRHRVAKAGRWLGGAVAYGYIVIRIRFERRIRIVVDAENLQKACLEQIEQNENSLYFFEG
jgi:DNA invertase Pin-like site-specific DNA recombinase